MHSGQGIISRFMEENNRKNNQVRFRRVSRARILDGHPFKPSWYAVLIMVMLSTLLTSSITLLFSYFYKTSILLAVWTLLPGAILGLSLLVLERSLGLLKNYMLPRMDKFMTAFLLFFTHALGYIAISSIVLNYPIGRLMERSGQFSGMAGNYSLFSVNFFIVLGLLSWWRNVRSGPSRCF